MPTASQPAVSTLAVCLNSLLKVRFYNSASSNCGASGGKNMRWVERMEAGVKHSGQHLCPASHWAQQRWGRSLVWQQAEQVAGLALGSGQGRLWK